jgi:hypothetical protein
MNKIMNDCLNSNIGYNQQGITHPFISPGRRYERQNPIEYSPRHS